MALLCWAASKRCVVAHVNDYCACSELLERALVHFVSTREITNAIDSREGACKCVSLLSERRTREGAPRVRAQLSPKASRP